MLLLSQEEAGLLLCIQSYHISCHTAAQIYQQPSCLVLEKYKNTQMIDSTQLCWCWMSSSSPTQEDIFPNIPDQDGSIGVVSTTSLCTRQHYVSPPSQKKGLQWVATVTESVWPRALFLCSKLSPLIPLHISATADLRPASSATCSSGTIMSVPVQQLTILLSSILSGGVFRVTGELLHQDYCALCLAQLSAAAALYNPIHGFSFAFPKTWN